MSLANWFRQQIGDLQASLERWETGRFKLFDGPHDLTVQHIEQMRSQIAELEDLLRSHQANSWNARA